MNIAVHHTLDTHRGQSKSTHASSESLADQFVQVRDETRDAFAITISFGYIPRWNVCRLETQATTRTPKSTGSWVPLPSKSGRGHEGISNERERKQLGWAPSRPLIDSLSLQRWSWLIHGQVSTYVLSLPFYFPPFDIYLYTTSLGRYSLDVLILFIMWKALHFYFSRSKKKKNHSRRILQVPRSMAYIHGRAIHGPWEDRVLNWSCSVAGSICLMMRTQMKDEQKEKDGKKTDWNRKQL